MAVVLFMGSMNASKMNNKNYELEAASCFEQAHYYAQWIGSMFEMTSIEQMGLILDYTRQCEDQQP